MGKLAGELGLLRLGRCSSPRLSLRPSEGLAPFLSSLLKVEMASVMAQTMSVVGVVGDTLTLRRAETFSAVLVCGFGLVAGFARD